MSVLNQKTIKENIALKGVGLHSGLKASLIIKPSQPNSGITFKRTDLEKNNIIIPNIFNVSSAIFCTTISNEYGVSVSTVEHLMGALYGMGIDNAVIEIDNQEIPILDGSAKIFGITILFSLTSVLLKIMPVFGSAGLIVKFASCPLCSPIPSKTKLSFIVFWFRTDIEKFINS